MAYDTKTDRLRRRLRPLIQLAVVIGAVSLSLFTLLLLFGQPTEEAMLSLKMGLALLLAAMLWAWLDGGVKR